TIFSRDWSSDVCSSDLFFKIINLRSGGLAIHGGLLFGILAGLICCKVWRISPLNFLDLMVPSIALAQSIGRWGNYFNQEAHGGQIGRASCRERVKFWRG